MIFFITGCNGKIASKLFSYLSKKEKTVIGLSYDKNNLNENFDGLIHAKKRKIICNYFKEKNLSKIFNTLPSKEITFYHFGWGGVSEPKNENLQYKNFQNTKSLIKILIKKSIYFQIKFFFAGSIEEYRANEPYLTEEKILNYKKHERPYEYYKNLILKENYNNKINNFSYIHLIISNVIGIKNNQNSLIKLILKSINNNESIHVKNFSSYRSFILLDDLTEVLYLLAFKIDFNEILNLGNERSYSMKFFYRNLHKEFKSHFNNNSSKIYFSRKNDEDRFNIKFRLDVNKAMNYTSRRLNFSYKYIIKNIINHEKKYSNHRS